MGYFVGNKTNLPNIEILRNTSKKLWDIFSSFNSHIVALAVLGQEEESQKWRILFNNVTTLSVKEAPELKWIVKNILKLK